MKSRAKDKEARFRARFDNDAGEYDDHRKAASHAVMMSHHAFEMGDKDAHKAAADAHRRVADMHDEAAEGDDAEKE